MDKHWVQDQRLRAGMSDVAQQMREHYPDRLLQNPEQPGPA